MTVDEFLAAFAEHAPAVQWVCNARGNIRVAPQSSPGKERICPVAFLANVLGHGSFRTGTFDLAAEALALSMNDAVILADAADYPLIAVDSPKVRAALLAAAGLEPDDEVTA